MSKILGIPNGSLESKTMILLKRIGLNFEFDSRKFFTKIEGSNIFDSLILMRPQDIPRAIKDGMIDAGITGFDQVCESQLESRISIIAELEYSKKTKNSVKVVVFGNSNDLVDNEYIKVVTEYPTLTKKVFKKAKIIFSHGGTEQKVAYGKYDYGVCVTETGDSIRKNELNVIKNILISPTVFVARKKCREICLFGELLIGGLISEKYCLLKMNLNKEKVSEMIKYLPSPSSPTKIY